MKTKGLDFLEMKKCPICGKHFSVLYPHLWRYKVQITSNRYKYFCSWKCLRADEQRRSNEPMKKLTTEQRQKAIEIAMNGNSPIMYLELTCGISNGPQCWSNIKKHLKERDPETWEKVKDVPKRRGGRKAKEAEPATVKLSGPIKIVTDEPEKVEIVEDEPKTAGEAMAACAATAQKFFDLCDETTGRKSDGVRELRQRVEDMHMGEDRTYDAVEVMGHAVRAIEVDPFGLFFYDHKHKWIDWTTPDGEEISMTPKQWWGLAYAIPEVFAILGVDPYEKSST